VLPLWSFQGARGEPGSPDEEDRPKAGLSKLSSVACVEVDMIPGEPDHRTTIRIPEARPRSRIKKPEGHRRAGRLPE